MNRRPPWLLQLAVRFSIARPWTIVAAWVAIAVIGVPGLLQLRFETTSRSFLDRSGPAWARYEASLDEFGGDEVIVVAMGGPRSFDPAILARIAHLTQEVEVLKGVRRVDSIASVPVVRGRPDGSLSLAPALPAHPTPGPGLSDQVRRNLIGDRIAPENLVSRDGRVFGMNVILESDIDDERSRVLRNLDALLSEGGAWVSGVPVFETRVSSRTRTETALFVPLALALLVIVLALSTRCRMGVVAPLVASGLPCLLLLELMGFLGFPFTMLSMLLPTVLLAIGCAYVMHLVVVTRGVRDREAFEERLISLARPTALSGATTAIGFLAISTAEIEAIRQMGLLGASGVLLALAATLTLAPALLRLAPRTASPAAWDVLIERHVAPRLLGVVWARRRAIVVCWAVLMLLFGWGLARLELETDAVNWFPVGSEIRRDYDLIRDRLSGISPMNVVIESKNGDSVASAEAVERIAALAAHLEGLPEVGRALSVADPLRQLHGGFTDDPARPVPGDSDLIAQYLLLLESVEQLGDLITPDRTRANVPLRMNHNGSAHLQRVAQAAERWWQEYGAPGFSASTTGIMFEFSRSEEAITQGQLQGLAMALVAIAFILTSVARSPRIATIALVPNAVPLVVVFGFLGLIGVPLDAGTVCLGSLALGIAVDDTTHIIFRYQDAIALEASPRRALAHAFRAVLPAVVLSTVAISVGFAVLGLSGFTLTRNLGLMTASIVITCMIADATLLPALLAWSGQRKVPSDARLTRWEASAAPLLEYDHQAVGEPALVFEKEPEPNDAVTSESWLASAIAMNPGFDLDVVSKEELIALSMLDMSSTYSLAIESNVLRDEKESRRVEPTLMLHRLLWPLAILESLRIMLKTLAFRARHLRLRSSPHMEDRARFLLGPRRIMSGVFDGQSPFIFAIRQGVTTSVALDILYNYPMARQPQSGVRGALTWFWCNEPHARGVRNRMKTVYWTILEAMREERRRGRAEIRILSLACGSAQAVIEALARFVKEDPDAEVSVELVDLDAPSLRRAARLAESRGVRRRVRFREENIRTFLSEDDRTWPIIEMVGFLDYRNDRSFVETCAKVHARLEPQGCFMTGTVCRSAWAGVVRWLANWPFLIRRRPRHFCKLLERAGFRSSLDRYEKDATGTFLVAALRRA
jgi:predicted RND superfamily exporter protein/SAM-dependent methyltransferase